MCEGFVKQTGSLRSACNAFSFENEHKLYDPGLH